MENDLRSIGLACIESHSKQALAISFVPLISVPLVHGVCVKMIMQLDKILGIRTAKGLDSEIFEDVLVGIIAAPAMMIPFVGAFAAATYIKTTAEYYLDTAMKVVAASSDCELEDSALIAGRIKEELHSIHTARRKRRAAKKTNH